MSFSLSPKQQEVRDMLAGPERHCLVYGGARSSKTFLLCYAILMRALSAPGSRHLICRLHNIDVRQSVMLDTWMKVCNLSQPHVKVTINKSDQYATLPNGSEVWFGGLDDKDRVDKILGKEYATIYFNEASQVAYESVLTVRTRLAQKCIRVDGRELKLKAYYDLNPTGQGHWTYKEFILKQRPDNGMPVEAASRCYAAMNPSDNPHLPKAFLEELDALPERQRMRFKDGMFLSEVPGALWPLSVIEANRVRAIPANVQLTRIVVAIDPSGSNGVTGDNQGIVTVGKGSDGHYYVMADKSCRLTPKGWADVAITQYHEWQADCVVAEVNYGGAMVQAVIENNDASVRYKSVTASRGKHIRAEPVAALYERGIVHHVGAFPEMEAQMGMMTTAGYQGGDSPGNLDALVWAIIELAGLVAGQGMMDFVREGAEEVLRQSAQPDFEMIMVEGPPGVGIVSGIAGHTYERAMDNETGRLVFRMRPEDANAMRGKVGWTVY